MLTRRTVLSGAALATGAALTRALPAFAAPLTDAQILRDPMRPTWHLMPARGWMNDPCGPIYWKGRYHMFFQYNPHAAIWGDMHWAHATSPDMVHWHREPIAIAPTPGGPDAAGVFTGTATVVDGQVAVIYTGVTEVPPEQATIRDGSDKLREQQCLAVAQNDMLMHWQKQPQAVIPSPPPGMQVTGFRDPCPFLIGNDWYLVVACGQRGIGGNVLLYRAVKQPGSGPVAALSHWEYLHPFAEGKWGGKEGANPVDTSEMWECPDFFELDGQHVLIHSTEGKTMWQIGTLDQTALRFQPESEGLLDHGAYYAPKSQLDAHGNRILWAFLPETRPPAEHGAAGWACCMSLPRQLSISNGQLVMEPVAQLASLRTQPRTGAAVKRLPTAAQELRLTLGPRNGNPPGSTPLEQSFVDNQGAAILLRSSADVQPGTARIGDREVTGIGSGPGSGPLDLRIFLDHSVAEIFINHRHAITRRYYKRDPMEPAVAITLGGPWQITRQQAWSLKSIW
jgi:beta-fructofuranosidase